MPAEVWANVQDQALTDADLPGLAAYSGALLIAAWPDATAQTLARLDRAGCPVKLWRWVSDPRGWPGWPRNYIARCPWAVFANEPDQEGPPPAWYGPVVDIWHAVNGLLVEPAWSDERKRRSDGWDNRYSAVSWHCYAGDFANRVAVLARANGRPVYGTEYGRPHAQQQCLIDLAAAGVSEPTALFAYPVWQGNASAGYDLRGVALTPLPPPPKGPTVPTPAPILRLPQQPGSLDCWIKCIEEFFLRYGHVLTDDLVFAAAKGHPRPAGGEAATFAEVKQGIAAIAQQLGVTVQLADFDDPATVMAALHDPNTANPWTVIAGVKESDLQPGQTYGHFLILDHEDAHGNITVTDSYAETDGCSGSYSKVAVEQAMVDSWEIAIDAIGAKIIA